MFVFDPSMEKIYAKCAPFDESEIAQSIACREISEELRAIRTFLKRRAPDIMECIDAYVDKYLEMVELECRHYFAEGYRMGCGKVLQFKNISMSDNDSPS